MITLSGFSGAIRLCTEKGEQSLAHCCLFARLFPTIPLLEHKTGNQSLLRNGPTRGRNLPRHNVKGETGMSIVTEWGIKTRALRVRSTELKAVDDAVLTWATKGQGLRDVNMQTVWTKFSAWKTAKPPEYTAIQAPADELQGELARQWTNKPAQMGGVGASNVAPSGWRLVVYAGTDLLPANQQAPPMTPAQISKVNEAMRRVKLAVEAARDTMLAVAKRKNFTAPMPAEEQAFTDFFGAYDEDRFNRVVANFQVLVLAFNGTPTFTDCRNRRVWANTYGGCVRANLATKSAKGVLALTGSVNMLIGRAFLGGGTYEKTSDDTICTLAHEFAHGSINAVDVPDVDNAGVFQCGRVSDDPAHADFGNSTDPFGHQSSQEPMDIIMARHHPEYALVNADCYGQFTKRILLNKQK
jgi:hypothetical protein